MIETLETGQPVTRFMEPGDTIRIEMIDLEGKSIFGAIDQKVTSIWDQIGLELYLNGFTNWLLFKSFGINQLE